MAAFNPDQWQQYAVNPGAGGGIPSQGVQSIPSQPMNPSPTGYQPNWLNTVLSTAGTIGFPLGADVLGIGAAPETGGLSLGALAADPALAGAGAASGNAAADFIRHLTGDPSISTQQTLQSSPGQFLGGGLADIGGGLLSKSLGTLFNPISALTDVIDRVAHNTPGTVDLGKALSGLKNTLGSNVKFIDNPTEATNAYKDLTNQTLGFLKRVYPGNVVGTAPGSELGNLMTQSPGDFLESAPSQGGPLRSPSYFGTDPYQINPMSTNNVNALDFRRSLNPLTDYSNPAQASVSKQMANNYQGLINQQLYQNSPLLGPLNAVSHLMHGINTTVGNVAGPALGYTLGSMLPFGELGSVGGLYAGRSFGNPVLRALYSVVPKTIFPYGGSDLSAGLLTGLLKNPVTNAVGGIGNDLGGFLSNLFGGSSNNNSSNNSSGYPNPSNPSNYTNPSNPQY